MFERFTGSARDAVVRAADHARQHGADAISARHQLLALTTPTTPAAHVLAGHGITEEALGLLVQGYLGDQPLPGVSTADAYALRQLGIDIDQVAASVHPHLTGSPSPTRRPRRRFLRSGSSLPFSAELKGALENSLRVAVRLRQSHISDLHLLAGLMEPGQREAPDLIRACEVDPTAVRQTVLDRLREAA